jgi:hypothetical protein
MAKARMDKVASFDSGLDLLPGRTARVRWTDEDGDRVERVAKPYRAPARQPVRLIPDVTVEPDVWDAALVRWHLIDAMRTLRRLPGGLAIGRMRCGLPEPVRSAVEAYGYERVSVRLAPDAAAIDRLDRALDWLLWVGNPVDRLIVTGTALGLSLRAVAQELLASGRLACSHETVRTRERAALELVAARLNRQADRRQAGRK